MFDDRSDGLLRGARTDRIRQIAALKRAEWNLDTILGVHLGLLDHSHEVSAAAMETLIKLAARKPVAVPVTPVMMLAYLMHGFTVASGADIAVVNCLADLHTAEADDALRATLESGHGSNEQFGRWVATLKDAGRADVLRQIHPEKLSSNRAKMLQRAVEG